MESKITKAWSKFNFGSKIQISWDGSRSQLEGLALVLESLLQSKINLQSTRKNLFRLVFTVLNSFVATEFYDGADRHFLKVFLETCTPVFQQLLEVN